MIKHVSASSLNLFERCGIAWEFRYVKKIKTTPGIGMSIGLAVHEVASQILKFKCRHDGQLLENEKVMELAKIAIVDQIQLNGLKLNEDEMKQGYDSVVAEAEDLVVGYSELYLKELAPHINPVNEDHVEVERRFSIPDFGFECLCYLDVDQEKGFRDLKTAGASKATQAVADANQQYTFYGLEHFARKKELPVIWQDTIKRTKTPKAIIFQTFRTEQDLNTLIERLRVFERMVKAGNFIPSPPDTWACTKKFCDYWSLCKYKY